GRAKGRGVTAIDDRRTRSSEGHQPGDSPSGPGPATRRRGRPRWLPLRPHEQPRQPRNAASGRRPGAQALSQVTPRAACSITVMTMEAAGSDYDQMGEAYAAHTERSPWNALYDRPAILVDRNSRRRSIRRPRRAGALQALMAASGGPARLVTHRQMGSSLRHPILPTPRSRLRGDPEATDPPGTSAFGPAACSTSDRYSPLALAGDVRGQRVLDVG